MQCYLAIGCSQVLFLGILSGHVHSITVTTWSGCNLLGRALWTKEKVNSPPEIRWEYEQVEIITILIMCIRCYSEH